MRHDIVLKQFDINDESSVLVEYTHASGDKVGRGDVLLSCETAKAITEIVSEWDGYVCYPHDEGSEVPVGAIILSVVDSMAEYEAMCGSDAGVFPVKKKADVESQQVTATRKARELASSLGLSLEDLPKKGLIKEADVRAFATKAEPVAKPYGSPRPSSPAKVFKYDNERIAIIGAGKGAEVLIDILLDDHDKLVTVLVDDKVRQFSAFGREYPVANQGIFAFGDSGDRKMYDTAIISISANLRSMQFRGRIFEYYVQREIPFTNIIAKSADIRRGVKMGQGNIVGANSYIGAMTEIGDNNLISYCAVVGHHNVVGNTDLLAPAMATSGSVKIGSNCIIPAGVNFINGVSVGNDVILPVGYNVSVDIADNSHIKDRR